MAVRLSRVSAVGRLAQLVRALPSHGRGQRFKSFVAHHSLPFSHYWRRKQQRRSCGCAESVIYETAAAQFAAIPPCILDVECVAGSTQSVCRAAIAQLWLVLCSL